MPQAILRERDGTPIKEVDLRDFYVAPDIVVDGFSYYIRVSDPAIHEPALYNRATVQILPKIGRDTLE